MAENQNAGEFDKLLKGYAIMKLRIIQHAAAIALAFFKQSFVNQGFTDQSLTKWKGRTPGSPNDKGRGLLFGSGGGAGTLKRGLRILKTSQDGAVVGMDQAIPYAEIQNFGCQIPITPKMRRFFWAMYYQAGGGKAKGKGQQAQKANATAQFYMNLAITKEQFITIPARQFIGDSAKLESDIMDYVTSELNKFFNVE